jgi:hypothetical protein
MNIFKERCFDLKSLEHFFVFLFFTKLNFRVLQVWVFGYYVFSLPIGFDFMGINACPMPLVWLVVPFRPSGGGKKVIAPTCLGCHIMVLGHCRMHGEV